jgi:hypothetical protein
MLDAMKENHDSKGFLAFADFIERTWGREPNLDKMISFKFNFPDQMPFSTSLDAAMVLVNRVGILLHLSAIGGDGLPLAEVGNPGSALEAKGFGPTLPLALCAAAIRLRGLEEKTKDMDSLNQKDPSP